MTSMPTLPASMDQTDASKTAALVVGGLLVAFFYFIVFRILSSVRGPTVAMHAVAHHFLFSLFLAALVYFNMPVAAAISCFVAFMLLCRLVWMSESVNHVKQHMRAEASDMVSMVIVCIVVGGVFSGVSVVLEMSVAVAAIVTSMILALTSQEGMRGSALTGDMAPDTRARASRFTL
jgi:hypothetical protein